MAALKRLDWAASPPTLSRAAGRGRACPTFLPRAVTPARQSQPTSSPSAGFKEAASLFPPPPPTFLKKNSCRHVPTLAFAQARVLFLPSPAPLNHFRSSEDALNPPKLRPPRRLFRNTNRHLFYTLSGSLQEQGAGKEGYLSGRCVRDHPFYTVFQKPVKSWQKGSAVG